MFWLYMGLSKHRRVFPIPLAHGHNWWKSTSSLPGEVKTEIGPFYLFPVTGPRAEKNHLRKRCFAVGEIMGSIECVAALRVCKLGVCSLVLH